MPSEEIKKIAQPKIYEGIMLVRQGKLKIVPGYDGVYGQISIFSEDAASAEKPVEGKEQMSLF
jgi:PHP family Zn ribbon phosphoesterase